MVNFKNFDYFRKTDEKQNTRIGGIVSLLSTLSILLLIYTQVIAFLTPILKKDLFVQSDIDVESQVEMGMSIVFPKAPCEILDMQIATGYTTLMRVDLESDFKFSRVKGKSGQMIGKATDASQMTSSQKTKTVTKAITEGEGCRIDGITPIYRVPGKMLFSTDTSNWLLSKLEREAPEIFHKVSLEHYLEKFSFGDATQTENIQRHFAEYPEHTKLDMVAEDAGQKQRDILENWDNTDHLTYFKFVSVVPHVFVDNSQKGKEVDYRSYSYAFSENRKDGEESSATMVWFIFEFSPVSMLITKSSQTLARFLINICAIVGGVFVVFGFLNGFLLGMTRQVTGK